MKKKGLKNRVNKIKSLIFASPDPEESFEESFMKRQNINVKYDKLMESRKWVKKIPFVQFPSDWQIKIIPPYRGAVVRFLVKKGKAEVSVYLDCYDELGSFGSPYWEVYPYDGDMDVYRCDMDAIDELLEAIKYSIDKEVKNDNK